MFSVVLDSASENVTLRQIPLSGRVAFAKFLCHPSSSPLIFRSTEIGQLVKRYPHERQNFARRQIGPFLYKNSFDGNFCKEILILNFLWYGG